MRRLFYGLAIAQNHTPTLWAGTNAGSVFIYQITVPGSDRRDDDPVQCILGKFLNIFAWG